MLQCLLLSLIPLFTRLTLDHISSLILSFPWCIISHHHTSSSPADRTCTYLTANEDVSTKSIAFRQIDKSKAFVPIIVFCLSTRSNVQCLISLNPVWSSSWLVSVFLPMSAPVQTQASAWRYGSYIISMIHPPTQPPCKVSNWHDRSNIELYVKNWS